MVHRNINEPTTKAAETSRSVSEEASRTARAMTEEATNAGEHAVRVSADIARRSAETAQEALRSGLTTATESLKRATDQFTQTFGFVGPRSEELARMSSQNLEAVAQANRVVAQGLQDLAREWFSLAQDQLTKHIEGLNALARCRSMQDFVAIQSGLVRDNLQQIIDGSRRIAEVSVRVADEAAQTIQAKAPSNISRRAA